MSSGTGEQPVSYVLFSEALHGDPASEPSTLHLSLYIYIYIYISFELLHL